MKKMLFGLLLAGLWPASGWATTYVSTFKAFSPSGVTYTKYVAAGSHTFIVDGVFQHTWAELYYNGTYIPPSQESYWPAYVDPTFSHSISGSDDIVIVVYNADNLSIWEKHRFIIDTTSPTTPGTPDLAAGDDARSAGCGCAG